MRTQHNESLSSSSNAGGQLGAHTSSAAQARGVRDQVADFFCGRASYAYAFLRRSRRGKRFVARVPSL